MKNIYLSLTLWVAAVNFGFSQTIEIQKMSVKKPLTVSGGFNANGLFTQGNQQTQALNYYLNGYFNFTIFQAISIPVMINYSDRKVNLSQGYNFNQISVHPTYKWVTAHLGTTNMNFSPYSLSGHQFTGGGLELSPKNWRIQVMNGRLLKGQYQDTLNTGPTFKRMGYGYRVEYNIGKLLVGTTLFKAKDIESTLPLGYRSFDDQVINPLENTVAGFHFGATLVGGLQLSGEYANSLITRDNSTLNTKVKSKSLAGLFQSSNSTTESNNAFKAKVNYNFKSTNTLVGLGYERIDPNYKTLGGYYFVNDLINYTVNFNQSLKKGQYVFGGNLGLQQDDIKNTKANKQNRFVANLNAQARISEGLNMGFMFSNFQSYKFLNDTYSKLQRVPGEIVDTLNYSLVSRTLGYNLQKSLNKTEERETSINFTSNYVASQNIHGELDKEKTDIVNTAITMAWRFPKTNFTFQTSLTHFYNGLPTGALSGMGPSFGLQKNFASEVLLGFNSSILQVTNKVQDDKYVSLNAQGNAAWKINDSHRFTLNFGIVSNQKNNFLNGNLGYNYTFK